MRKKVSREAKEDKRLPEREVEHTEGETGQRKLNEDKVLHKPGILEQHPAEP